MTLVSDNESVLLMAKICMLGDADLAETQSSLLCTGWLAGTTGCLPDNTAVSTLELLLLSTDTIAMSFSCTAALINGLDGEDCCTKDTELLDEVTLSGGNIM